MQHTPDSRQRPAALRHDRPRLRLPPRDRRELSFCDGTTSGIDAWLAALPHANAMRTLPRIGQALVELARLRAAPHHRLALLERVRPMAREIADALDGRPGVTRHISTTDARRAVRLAQDLQRWLATGYEVAVADFIVAPEPQADKAASDATQPTALALHRALSELAGTLARSLGHHAPVPKALWRELYQLRRLVEHLGLVDTPVADTGSRPQRSDTTVGDAFMRPLLLATAQPHALRRPAVALLFEALEDWARFSLLSPVEPTSHAPYWLDLDQDAAPASVTQMSDTTAAPRLVETRPLAAWLEALADDRAAAAAPAREPPSTLPAFADHLAAQSPPRRPDAMTVELLLHAASAWAGSSARRYRRVTANGTLELVVGFAAAHYRLAGEIEFEVVLQGGTARFGEPERNPFLDPEGAETDSLDVWAQAFDVSGARIPVNPDVVEPDAVLRPSGAYASRRAEPETDSPQAEGADRYPISTCHIVDLSPGGYGLKWLGPVPPRLQTGEVLIMRERGLEGWSVGIVRWIREEANGVKAGVQRLAPEAHPAAIRMVSRRGPASRWQRALILPELEALEQSERLLVPRLPVESVHQLQLNEWGSETSLQLAERVDATPAALLFTFERRQSLHRASMDDAANRHDALDADALPPIEFDLGTDS